jgi:hypothetical protein
VLYYRYKEKNMIEVGSLLRMWGNHSTWLALDEIAGTVLVINQKTNYKMWADKAAFEVIG